MSGNTNSDMPEQFRAEERVAYRIYKGDTSELIKGMEALDLIIEERRSDAAEVLGNLIKGKLMRDGYIVIRDVEASLEQFHLAEALRHRPLDEPAS